MILGLSLYVLGALAWIWVLAKADVSFAYPFVGLGFILTMFLGWFVLQEPLTMIRFAGTILMVAGVYHISGS